MKHKILGLCLALALLVIMVVPVAAASHDGTYSMTGGIFYKQAFASGTDLEITVMPETGTIDCNMGIYTAKNRTLLGWAGADYINSVSSVFSSVSEYTTTEAIDGIYFRNWSGYRWTGSFRVVW